MRQIFILLCMLISSGITQGADFVGINAGHDGADFVQAMENRQFDIAASTFDYAQAPFSGVRLALAKNLELVVQELGGLAGARRLSAMPELTTAMVEMAAIRPATQAPQITAFRRVTFEVKSPKDGTVYYQAHLVPFDAEWRVSKLQVHIVATDARGYERVKEIVRWMTHGREAA